MWRRLDTDLVAGQPGVVWTEPAATEHPQAGDASTPFVSTATLFAWTLTGLEEPTDIVELACAVTHETPGWRLNGRVVDESPGETSIRLTGALDSPFGPLISNVHNVAFPIVDGVVLLQLTVTATPTWHAETGVVAVVAVDA